MLKSVPETGTVLLVDDGSTDNTLDELLNFDHDKRVKVISGSNKGFTRTLVDTIDTHLNPALHKYLAVYGSGDICSEDKFVKQLEYMEENTDIAALGTGHSVYSYNSHEKILEEASYYEADFDNLFERVPFTHGTVMYRVSDYRKAGGYHAVLKYSQDKDLYLRLIHQGRIVRYPESLYTQYVFEDSASSKPAKKKEQIKYQHILFLNYRDHEQYKKDISRLEKESINDIYQDSMFVRKYKLAQKRLILQGEFDLAAQWCDILYPIEGETKQKRLKPVLKTAKKVPFLKKLTPKLFYIARKMLR